MKILFVTIDGRMSGGNQICLTLLRAAIQAGHQAEVLSPSLGPLTEELANEDVRIHIFKLDHSYHLHQTVVLASLLRKSHIDLVHTHTSLNSELLCRIACFFAHVPIVCHQHEPADAYHPNPLIAACQRWLDRVTSKSVNQFIAVSNNRKDAMIEMRKYQPDRVRLIYNGIDLDRFSSSSDREEIRRNWNLNPDQTAVGLIGRLEIAKGQATLIEAAPRVLKRFGQTRFFIIGGDHVSGEPSLKKYQKMIQDFGLQGRCFLLGFREDVHKLIHALDMVVLPSWWEGHPLVVLEAMAAQKPVIASNVGGTPEIIDHEKNGLLIPPRDPAALADAICRLIEDPALGKKMAKNGYEKVTKHFDQRNMIDEVLALYDPMRVSVPNEKLAVVTEIISPYRIPVFNQLAEILGDRFKVFFMSATCPGRQWSIPYSKIKFNFEIVRGINLKFGSNRANPMYWNPGIGRALQKFSPGAVVIGGYHHISSYLVRRYARSHQIPFFLWCESTLFEARSRNSFVGRFKGLFIRSSSGYLVPGKASEDYLKSYQADKPFFYAPNSIDHELFSSGSRWSDSERRQKCAEFRSRLKLPGFVILFVGRLSPEKNIPVAFQVLQNLQQRNFEIGFVLVGDGPQRKKYEAMRHQLGLKNVVFLGFKEQEELPYYYGVSDLLILPSESEPWGLVVNESLTCGLPVLCSNKVGCAQDLIIEAQTGYMCSAIADYEKRIAQFYEHPVQIEEMRERCRRHSTRFTPQHCAQGFLDVIEAINNESLRNYEYCTRHS